LGEESGTDAHPDGKSGINKIDYYHELVNKANYVTNPRKEETRM